MKRPAKRMSPESRVGEDAAYKGAALPVPPNFDELAKRKADHFDALVAVLAEAAQSTVLFSADFEFSSRAPNPPPPKSPLFATTGPRRPSIHRP